MFSRRVLCLAVGLAVTLAGLTAQSDAHAQACIEPSKKATQAEIDQARKHMEAGLAFYNDPDGYRYEEAYPEFKRAYQLSGSLNALRMLSICAMKLELDGEALECYQRLQAQMGDSLGPDVKNEVEQDLRALQASVAWLSVSSDRPEVTLKDERTPRRGAAVRSSYKIGIAQIKLGIHPGSHKLTASAAGFPDQSWEVEIKNGAQLNHEFVFEPNKPVTADGLTDKDLPNVKKPPEQKKPEPPPPPPPPDEGPSRPVPAYVWGMLGVTAAAGIGGGVVAGLASAKKSDYDENLRGKVSEADQQAAVDDIKTKNLVADILFGVTGAAAVTTLVLFLTRPEEAPGESKAADAARRFGIDWTLGPLVGPDGGGATITGSF